ncbi:MAG: aminotransferase class V-fold PLP-dependent enzyme [Candidatus Korarchaeota archaeon]|nr:aminotransferase class V-fold PLP-dependent enzyme [Thermoproteota archaeon]MCR8463283.1 aminotransferase class V-fold PLP-dependent enzyme [Thermoproteota archaeon]MCR8470890.1 aminotransferase class V-fold PLP-dependent enzyme [Thermoproteota archaeon]MCR8472420.1 aminotransferase class V-fold PLP-dependent enzyme [Thermoproteota archaeon]MCR8473562.1 aminotransferase class V-fold PLP-dependent enzyme [Thermoproteota archaeon]
MVNWPTIRAHFPGISCGTYLNTASIGLIPDVSISALENFIRQRCFGNIFWLEWYSALDDIRTHVSRLINANYEEIAFVQNTSMGLNLIANSINWQSGDNIVINDLEFPTNVFPWQVVAKRYNLELRCVRNVNGMLRKEDFEKVVDERTKTIAVSWVEFGNGFVNDLRFLSKLAHENGALLVVDGIQGVGALKIDVKAMGVDILVCGFQKWLLGIGSGFLYIDENVLGDLKVPFAGWLSDKDPYAFDFREYEPASGAKRFELGSPSFADALVARESLRFIAGIGIENIEKRDLELISYLRKRLAELDRVIFMTPEGTLSPILTFKLEGIDTKSLLEYLLERNIYVSVRLGALRVSPHFYNNAGDIDRLLNALIDFSKSSRQKICRK